MVSSYIADFVIDKYANPARVRGNALFWVRAGDVHDAIGLKNRLPAVCATLGSNRFESVARARRIAVDGPTNGANSFWVYRLLE